MKLVLILALLVTGCGIGSIYGVTPQHWQEADKMCVSNGAVLSITEASRYTETKSCGYRCTAATGRIIYSETFKCGNGAEFEITFVE